MRDARRIIIIVDLCITRQKKIGVECPRVSWLIDFIISTHFTCRVIPDVHLNKMWIILVKKIWILFDYAFMPCLIFFLINLPSNFHTYFPCKIIVCAISCLCFISACRRSGVPGRLTSSLYRYNMIDGSDVIIWCGVMGIYPSVLEPFYFK